MMKTDRLLPLLTAAAFEVIVLPQFFIRALKDSQQHPQVLAS
jgi:hypothetical protein